jgi:glycosyltransferase involved in cell wall biosynthesis
MARTVETIALMPAGDRFEDFHDKIAVTLDDFRRELTGGWLFNYVQALQLAGVRTVLIFASARVKEPARFIHEPTGCDVTVLPVTSLHLRVRGLRWRWAPSSGLLRSLEAYLAMPAHLLATELRMRGCDAVICQEYESPKFDVAVLVGRLLGLPVFGTYQGQVRGHSAAENPLRRLVMRHCDGLIVAAAGERNRIRRRYGVQSTKIAAIANPVDLDTREPIDKVVARVELGIPNAARVVVWHGRVQIHRKGLDLLVEAWRRVCEECPELSPLLLLVGSGVDVEELRRMLSTLPSGSFLWIDEYVRDRQRLQRCLIAADLAVLPSRHEGFPVAIIEAMASGLPVIATEVDGVREALGSSVGSTGDIVPCDDIDGLVKSLRRALCDPEGTAIRGRAARQRAEECFGLSTIGEQLSKTVSGRRAQAPAHPGGD